MDEDKSTERREVKGTTEARAGQVSKGQPMKWVLIISTISAALALLVIYLFFVAA